MLNMMLQFIEGNYDPLEFSMDLEDFFANHYDEMERENKNITDYFNEDLPEICAEYEHGEDPTDFKAKVKEQYDKALLLLKN